MDWVTRIVTMRSSQLSPPIFCIWLNAFRPTKEFRESLTKLASASTEKAKTIIRKLRQDGMKELKKDLKAGMSEDENYALEKKVWAR
jgi:ribosome recycling factor